MNYARLQKNLSDSQKHLRHTTFLSENLREDVGVSLEEKCSECFFWMHETSGKASTDSTGLKKKQSEHSVFILDIIKNMNGFVLKARRNR